MNSYNQCYNVVAYKYIPSQSNLHNSLIKFVKFIKWQIMQCNMEEIQNARKKEIQAVLLDSAKYKLQNSASLTRSKLCKYTDQ